MRKSLFIILSALFVPGWIFGQSVADSARITLGYPLYSQYLQNGMMINPAYAGSRDALSISISRRDQWFNVANSPVINTLSLHTPLKNEKVSLGLIGGFMKYGATTSQSIYAVYAYRLKFSRGKLAFGLKAGFDMSKSDYSLIKNTITYPDPAFPDDARSYIFPNVGAGIYYSSKSLFAGISIPSFLFYRNLGSGKTQAYHSFNEYDILFSGGGLITFSEDFKLKPSFLVDYSMWNSEHINQLDLNANFIIADVLWVGGSYRTTEQAAVGIVQVQATQKVMFGASYDIPVGRMETYSHGSTEFFLRYEFGSKVSVANPRYF